MISTETSKVRYSGNDSTTVFPLTFPFLEDSHLEVIVADENDVQTTLVLDTDYSVSGAGGSSGSVTYPISGEPLPAGHTITINRVVPLKQLTDFENQGGFFAETHEDAFDYVTMALQQMQEELDRSVKVSVTSGESGEDILDSIDEAVADASQYALLAKESAEESEVSNLAAQTAQGLSEAAQTAAEQAQQSAEYAQAQAEIAQAAAEAAASNFPTFEEPLVVKELGTPSNPSSGYRKLYVKTDGNLYVLDSIGNESQVGAGEASVVRGTFTNASLSAGKLTVTHNGGLSAPYTVLVRVVDNTGAEVECPVACSENSFEIDLTDFGTLTGTWGYIYLVDGTTVELQTITINTLTEKTSVVDDDILLIEDSEASNAQKKVKVSTIVEEAQSGMVSAPIGAIVLWGTESAPSGYLLCDGSQVSRTTYADLFAVIGTTFGAGNGSSTFNLPNFKGKVPVGQNSVDSDFNELGETGGAKRHTLSTGEMPSHSHTIDVGYYPSGSGADFGGTPANKTGVSQPASTNTAGGGQAHNNLQPYIVLNYIIKH